MQHTSVCSSRASLGGTRSRLAVGETCTRFVLMTDTDPFLWLEDVEGEKPLAWVREQNARTLKLLEADPRFQRLYDTTLAIITADDRIPYPRFFGTALANFWQDQAHVRGLWRKTSLESYRTAEPLWETVLDIDALAVSEGKNWVYQG